MNKSRPTIIASIRLYLLIVLLFPPALVPAAQAAEKDMLAKNNFAVMPCRLGRATPNTPADRKNIIDCTLAELCYLEGDPLEDAAAIVTDLLQREMERRFGARVEPLDRVREKSLILGKKPDETLRTAAMRLGRELKVDFVLASTLWRFDERQGNPAGIEKPASVAFAVFLVRVEDGRIYWQDLYDKTQSSLTENLLEAPLFWAKGVKWLSGRELAAYGVETMFADFFGE